jgi:hypothetical protein
MEYRAFAFRANHQRERITSKSHREDSAREQTVTVGDVIAFFRRDCEFFLSLSSKRAYRILIDFLRRSLFTSKQKSDTTTFSSPFESGRDRADV